ncbi:MAG: hypothetical protein MI919_24500, partial [Holophagales bacterium]|nr:hypothetical protein [Holophagales bacterium]
MSQILWIRVRERLPGETFDGSQGTTFTVEDFHHSERTSGTWHKNTPAREGTFAGGPDNLIFQEVCNHWDGETCETADNLSDTSEWSTTVFYQPAHTDPGTDILLSVVAKIRYYDGEEDEWYYGTIRQLLKVHLGEAPLPTFGSDWAYGDLHHHSQGTDNSAEVGNSFRNTLLAMNALGLDFAFATDHTNNNRQIGWAKIDIDLDLVLDLPPLDVDISLETHYYGLGDMSAQRWENHWHLLNGIDGNPFTGEAGANLADQALSYPRMRTPQQLALPQLFLGGEVDIVPEILAGREHSGMVSGAVMELANICRDLPEDYEVAGISLNLKALVARLSSWEALECGSDPGSSACDFICGVEDLLVPTGEGTMKIRDIQNLGLGFARQHLIHLPRSSADSRAEVLGNTSDLGGASLRLKDLIEEEFGIGQKGYFFMAHPTNFARGSGLSRLGPDIIPFSEIELRQAFDSEYFLGLQGWNSNKRLASKLHEGDASDDLHDQYHDRGPFFYHAAPVSDIDTWNHDRFDTSRRAETWAAIRLWDVLLRWSLDPAIRPGDWVDDGEPRKVFMA